MVCQAQLRQMPECTLGRGPQNHSASAALETLSQHATMGVIYTESWRYAIAFTFCFPVLREIHTCEL